MLVGHVLLPAQLPQATTELDTSLAQVAKTTTIGYRFAGP
jgi:hypothetical protein